MLPDALQTYTEATDFYIQADGYKILDNGAAENRVPTFHQLMRLAKKFSVDEIVVPDVLGDANATIKMARVFASHAHKHPEFKYMGVLQGHDYPSILKCAHFYAVCDWVTCIGVPRLLCDSIHTRVRTTIVEALSEQNDWERFEWHMLGSSRWIVEPSVLASLPRIRSMDTSYPCYMSLLGKNVVEDGWEPRPKSYFGVPYYESVGKQMRRQCDKYAQLARAEVR
jgi:hypothetical protein